MSVAARSRDRAKSQLSWQVVADAHKPLDRRNRFVHHREIVKRPEQRRLHGTAVAGESARSHNGESGFERVHLSIVSPSSSLEFSATQHSPGYAPVVHDNCHRGDYVCKPNSFPPEPR